MHEWENQPAKKKRMRILTPKEIRKKKLEEKGIDKPLPVTRTHGQGTFLGAALQPPKRIQLTPGTKLAKKMELLGLPWLVKGYTDSIANTIKTPLC